MPPQDAPPSIFRDPQDETVTAGVRPPISPMPAFARYALMAATAVLALAGGLAAASYWDLGAPSTFAVLPIAQPYATRAEALIAKPNPSRTELRAAEDATLRELAIAPRRTDGHLRLAIIEVLRDGGLTVRGLNELKRSYDFVPLDPDVFASRIRFGLEHWGELDDEARTRVSTEIAVTSKYRPAANVRAIVESVANPQGRFGGLMSLSLDPVQAPTSSPSVGEAPAPPSIEVRDR